MKQLRHHPVTIGIVGLSLLHGMVLRWFGLGMGGPLGVVTAVIVGSWLGLSVWEGKR